TIVGASNVFSNSGSRPAAPHSGQRPGDGKGTPMKITQTARAALLAAGMLVLAGCGGSSGTQAPATTQAPPSSASGMATESASPSMSSPPMSEGGQAGGEMGAAGTLATAQTSLGK